MPRLWSLLDAPTNFVRNKDNSLLITYVDSQPYATLLSAPHGSNNSCVRHDGTVVIQGNLLAGHAKPHCPTIICEPTQSLSGIMVALDNNNVVKLPLKLRLVNNTCFLPTHHVDCCENTLLDCCKIV